MGTPARPAGQPPVLTKLVSVDVTDENEKFYARIQPIDNKCRIQIAVDTDDDAELVYTVAIRLDEKTTWSYNPHQVSFSIRFTVKYADAEQAVALVKKHFATDYGKLEAMYNFEFRRGPQIITTVMAWEPRQTPRRVTYMLPRKDILCSRRLWREFARCISTQFSEYEPGSIQFGDDRLEVTLTEAACERLTDHLLSLAQVMATCLP